MLEQLIISGFGGQGILFLGQLVGHAAVLEGREVTYMPSYGPEMRGGAAHCSVIISDRRIMSPLVSNPSSVIVLNRPSLDRFAPTLRPGGLLIANSSMVDRTPYRDDIRIIQVPASQIAERVGSTRLANVVVLGCYIGATGVLAPDSVVAALPKMLTGQRSNTIPANTEAFNAGLDWRVS